MSEPRTVWKFPLKITREQTLAMPAGAVLLHVEEQLGILCLWALVYPKTRVEDRHFVILGTGHPAPENNDMLRPVGSALCDGGTLVWHVFEDRA